MSNSTQLLDALTMAALNFCATVVLLALHTINALYNWPNPFVTIAAPLGAAVFLILTAVWFLEWMRRVRARRLARMALASAAGLPIHRSQPRPVLLHHPVPPTRRLGRAPWRRIEHARSV